MRLILCLIPRMDSWMLMPVDANFWNPSDSSKRPYHYHYHYQIIKYQIINHKSYPKKNERPKIPVVHGGGVRSESLVTILFLGVSEWVRIEIQWGRRTAPHRFNFWISNERLWKCSHPEPAWASCSWVKDNVKCQSTFNLQVSTISLSQSPSTKLVSITTSHA